MRQKLYRSRKGVIFGICQGFANHFDLSVVWIRLGLVIFTLFTGIFPVPVIYAIAALVIPLEPESRPMEDGNEFFDEDFFGTDISPRTLSLRRLKSKYDAIEARIRRMETYVTNKSYDWERRFHSGK